MEHPMSEERRDVPAELPEVSRGSGRIDQIRGRFDFGRVFESMDQDAARPEVEISVPPSVPKELKGKPLLRWAVTCGVFILGLLLMLGPPIYHLARMAAEGDSQETWRRRLCMGLLSQSLPPVNQPFFLEASDVESTPPPKETLPEETRQETEGGVADTEATDPPGALGVPIVSMDISEWSKGVTYIRRMVDCELPDGGDVGSVLSARDVVLIVHSHPYETYGDGGDMALWEEDGWAVEIPSDVGYPNDGVVALGERLTLLLRLRGVNVIHAVLPRDNSLSHMDTYEKTKEMVEAMLATHPKIKLVVDLRRSAAQTPAGELIRTEGVYQGKRVAQIGVFVNVPLSDTSWKEDARGAVLLRHRLYGMEKTLCAPVTLIPGNGMGAGSEALFWTLTLGSAGNTYEEAAALLIPLADALGGILSNS